ncbi:MAG: hypothetical protein J3K34DRAFT_212666 [Monoraphidium minutum]|nr:MAG: hypothetical protein J3K34DRAFT_212666 [Monoraphidium minutum]
MRRRRLQAHWPGAHGRRRRVAAAAARRSENPLQAAAGAATGAGAARRRRSRRARRPRPGTPGGAAEAEVFYAASEEAEELLLVPGTVAPRDPFALPPHKGGEYGGSGAGGAAPGAGAPRLGARLSSTAAASAARGTAALRAAAGAAVAAAWAAVLWVLRLVAGLAAAPLALAFGGWYNHNRRAKERARATLSRPLTRHRLEEMLGALPAWLAGMGGATERLEWLNRLLADVWPVLDPVASEMIKATVEPMLDQFKPPFIAKMGFQRITLGELPVVLEGIRVARGRRGRPRDGGDGGRQGVGAGGRAGHH